MGSMCTSVLAEWLYSCYTTLGGISKARGLLPEAEVLHLKALDIRMKAHGSHETTALSLHNHAYVLYSMDRKSEAM